VLLDIEVGKLKRFRDNGIEQAVAPKKWANAVPVTRGLMTITYTREQALFVSDGLGVHCSLVCIHRAQLLENRNQLFAFSLGDGALTIMEFETASRRASTRPGSFVDQLVTVRDAERAKLPAERREALERLDLVVQMHSLDELWARPSAPVSMEPDDVAALSGPGGSDSAGDGIDEVAWNRLRVLVTAAHAETRSATYRRPCGGLQVLPWRVTSGLGSTCFTCSDLAQGKYCKPANRQPNKSTT
jgi:hypothetical protein